MRKSKYRIALAQMNSGADRAENLKKAEEYIRRAAARGVELIAFPEVMDYFGPDLAGHAQSAEGETISFLREQAAKYGMHIHSGSITERQPGGRAGNTSFLIGPNGDILGSYSKLHLFDVDLKNGFSYRESDTISGGHDISVVDTSLGRIGLSICYDLRFPELFRLMALEGADLILLCANFTESTGRAHWETLLRARAIENTCYVAAVGQCGQKKDYRSHGHSMLIDPWGEVTASLENEEGLLTGEVDPDRIRQVREQIPSLRNRRTDVYTLQCKN